MKTLWLNGKFLNADLLTIDADNRGLLLGEGVFETLLCVAGQPADWDLHWARLQRACHYFDLPMPYVSAAMLEAAQTLLTQNRHATQPAVLRVTVNSGSGGRGLVPSAAVSAPLWLMQSGDFSLPPATLKLHISDYLRLSNAPTSLHKTTNYLDLIMARKQAKRTGADEALLFNERGQLATAAAGNVFVQSGERLLTPPTTDGALAGIIRHKVLSLQTVAGFAICQESINRETLESSQAILVCNSLQGIRQGASINGRTLPPSSLATKINQAIKHPA